MRASLIFPLPLPESYFEEKTQEKIDKSSDWGWKKEHNKEKEKETVLLQHHLCPFTHREKSKKNFGTIQRWDRDKVKTTQDDIPENNNKEKAKKNTRKRPRNHLRERTKKIEEVCSTTDHTKETWKYLMLHGKTERGDRGQEGSDKR